MNTIQKVVIFSLFLCVNLTFTSGKEKDKTFLKAPELSKVIALKKQEIQKMELKRQKTQSHLQQNILQERNNTRKLNKISQQLTNLQKEIDQIRNRKQNIASKLGYRDLATLSPPQLLSVQKKLLASYRVFFPKSKFVLRKLQQQSIYKDIYLLKKIVSSKISPYFFQNLSHIADHDYQEHVEQHKLQKELYEKKLEMRVKLLDQQQGLEKKLLMDREDQRTYREYLDQLQQNLEKEKTQINYLNSQKRWARQFKYAKGLRRIKGKIPPPVKGRVIQLYGTAGKHPLAIQNQSQGIIIETSSQANVKAVALGKIVFAEKVEGYQNLVIIDHGKDTFSVYGHLGNLLVRQKTYVGDRIVIGQSGQDPVTQQYHTYFEIRDKKRTIDPIRWLKKGSY